MIPSAAIDHGKQSELNKARIEPPQADDFRHVRQNGRANGYLHSAPNRAPENSSPAESENSHSDNLKQARESSHASEAKKAVNLAGDVASMATPMGALSLLRQVNFLGDIPYAAALGAAMLKDLLDLVTFQTIMLPMVFAALCSIFILMMMLLVGSSGQKKAVNGMLKKIGVLIMGGMADAVPGLSFTPIETLTAAVLYFMTLSERKHMDK